MTPLTQSLNAGTTIFVVTLLSAQDAAANVITHQLTSSWTLTGYQTPAFTMLANAPTRLQILLPGHTAVPGDVAHAGKTGSISSAMAGAAYPITARLTDDYYNAIGNNVQNAPLRLTTTDPYDPSDPDTSLSLAVSTAVAGSSVTWTHPFQTANAAGWTVNVSTQSGPSYIPPRAGPIVVTPDTLTGGIHTHQLLLLLPGETYVPGNIAIGGRQGPVDFTATNGHNPAQAGDVFPITVVGTDRFYNKLADADNPAVIVNTDPTLFPVYSPAASFTLNAGSNSITASIHRSTTTYLYANLAGAPQTYTYLASTSTVFTVSPAAASHLQLLIQGESAVPGSPTGKTGTPVVMTAGAVYFATVNATDALFNRVNSASAKVKMVVNDPFSPTTNVQQDLLSGSVVFNLQFNTANATGWLVNVSTTSGPGVKHADQSVLLPVSANTSTRQIRDVAGPHDYSGQRRRVRRERIAQCANRGRRLESHGHDHGCVL